MNVFTHKNFLKQYKRLTANQKNNFKKRLSIFLKDPFNPLLKNHSLEGKFINHRSINIGGDLRLIYKSIDEKRSY